MVKKIMQWLQCKVRILLSKYAFSHVRKKKEHVKTGVLYLAKEQIAVLADCKLSITNHIKGKFIIT